MAGIGSQESAIGSIPTAGKVEPGTGGTGAVHSVVAGTGIGVNNADPANPIVSNTGVLSVVAGTGTAVDSSDPLHPIVGLDGNASNFLRPGVDLPDANITINPGFEQVSQRTLRAAVLTAARVATLGVSGSPPAGTQFDLVRRDLSANTYTVNNGGPGGGTLLTFAGSPLTPQGAKLGFDGTNWNFIDFFYVQGGTYAPPVNPLFLAPLLWLRADLGVTLIAGKASAWLDQSGTANHAAQAVAGNRFTFNASSINGKPGMTGTAATFMNIATGVWASGATRWLIAVVKAASPGGGFLFSTRTNVPVWLANCADDGAIRYCYSDLSTKTTATNPYVPFDGNGHVCEYASAVGAPIGFSIDGTTYPQVNTFGVSPNVISDTGGAAAAQLGDSVVAAGNGFVGDICEIIAGAGALSALQLFELHAYLTARYGIAIP